MKNVVVMWSRLAHSLYKLAHSLYKIIEANYTFDKFTV